MACAMRTAGCGFAAAMAVIMLSAFCVGFASESDADSGLQMSIETVYAISGDSSIEVPVIIESNSGFFGGEFSFSYDPNLVLTGISPGIIPITVNDNYGLNPYPFYAENSSLEDLEQTGLLVTLIFDVAKNSVGEFPIVLDYSDVYNINGSDVGVSCSDGAVSISSVRIPVSGVTVDPASITLNVSQTASLAVNVSPSNATNKNVTWRSSNASVASVSSSGVVTGISAGTASIFATTQDGSYTGLCVVTVNEGVKVTNITLSADSLSLETGDTYSLKATILPVNATDKRITWTSSNSSVASVDSSGKVAAVSAGTAFIMATAVGGDIIPAVCMVQVTEKTVSVTGVSLDINTLSLTEGEQQTLYASVTPSNAADKSVTWKSSNAKITTVSSAGVVTAVSAGTATITVTTADGGYTDACRVTVTEPEVKVTGVSLSDKSLSIAVGEKYTLTAAVSPDNAADKSVTWKSNNVKIATVSSAGVVTAVAAGTATITVTTADGGYTDTCRVTVTKAEVSVTGISLSASRASVETGNTYTLKATIAPSDATNKGVAWSSSNPKIASVSGSGIVTGVSPGTATITVTSSDGGYKAVCVITVVAPAVNVNGVSLGASELALYVGDKHTLNASVAPDNATDKSVTWKSSNTKIAAVSSAGVVTAVAAGTATITVTTADGGYTDTCKVTVTKPVVQVTGVSLSSSTLGLVVGDKHTLNASVAPDNATDKSVTWKSNNVKIATVSSAGVVTAVKAGTATITVTTADGGYTAACRVTVSESEVKVTGVSLSDKSLSIAAGEKYTLTAAVSPDKATDKSVTWKSNNVKIATVSSSGVVTAVKAGTATITVTTADGGYTDTCRVTVTKAAVSVTGIELDETSLTIEKGFSAVLTATVLPADASDKTVTWKSSRTSVATVDGGVVKGVAAGTARITVTTSDGGFSAVCTVTVEKPSSEISEGDVFVSDGIEYTVLSGGKTAEATGCSADVSVLNLPASVSYKNQTLTVESIGAKAFYGNGSIVSADTGKAVSVGSKAFANCSSLRDVTVGAESIGSYAFYGCPGIERISFSEGLSSVGTAAFGSLQFRDIGDGSIPRTAAGLAGKEFSGSDGILYYSEVAVGEKFVLDGLEYKVTSVMPSEVSVTGYEGEPAVVSVPAAVEYKGYGFAVTYIASKAFYGCESLVFADISAVSSTGNRVFAYCTGLASAVFDLKEIEAYTFYRCTGLKYADLSGVESIGARSFVGCTGLVSASFSESLSGVGTSAFYGVGFRAADGTPLEASADALAGKTFAGTGGILSERLSVGGSFFSGGLQYTVSGSGSVSVTGYEEGITVLIVPDTVSYAGTDYSVDSVGTRAFYRCQTLAYADLGSVSSVGERAFTRCSALAAVKMSAAEIGPFCFYGCPLRDADLSSAVSIGQSAFGECRSLSSMVFSDLLLSVGKNAFEKISFSGPGGAIAADVQGLAGKAFVGENSVLYVCPEIGTSFSDGTLVYTVTSVMPNEAAVTGYEGTISALAVPLEAEYGGMPFSVTSIGDQAFFRCGTLVYAYLGGVGSIGFKAFSYCTELVYVDSSAENIGGYAFFGCSKLYGIDLSSAETIGASAFSGVPLSSAVFSAGLLDVGKNAFYGLTFRDGSKDLSPTAGNLAGKSFAGSGKVLSLVS